jgi:hypothetical protein
MFMRWSAAIRLTRLSLQLARHLSSVKASKAYESRLLSIFDKRLEERSQLLSLVSTEHPKDRKKKSSSHYLEWM